MITISLDGDEETHDKLRGVKGNYQKCVKLYDKLKSEGINANYGITVSDSNNKFIEEKYKFYRDTIRAVTFVHSEIYKTENQQEDIKILEFLKIIYKNYFIKNIQEIIEKIHIKISIKFLEENRKKI